MRNRPRKISAVQTLKKLIGLGLLCGSLVACSTNPFGPPDDPSATIPPARPSPFEGEGSGGNASPWSGSGMDSAAPQSSH